MTFVSVLFCCAHLPNLTCKSILPLGASLNNWLREGVQKYNIPWLNLRQMKIATDQKFEEMKMLI